MESYEPRQEIKKRNLSFWKTRVRSRATFSTAASLSCPRSIGQPGVQLESWQAIKFMAIGVICGSAAVYGRAGFAAQPRPLSSKEQGSLYVSGHTVQGALGRIREARPDVDVSNSHREIIDVLRV